MNIAVIPMVFTLQVPLCLHQNVTIQLRSVKFKLLLCFLMNFVRAKGELNEEATRYLKNFPEEMIFHTSNLHLLDSVGQGNKM